MPTFNQLVRQGRNARVYKSKSPVLQKGYNSLEGKTTDQRCLHQGFHHHAQEA